MDPFFGDLGLTYKKPESYKKAALMKTDIKVDGDNYVFEIEMPGVNKNDIELSLNEGYLKVTFTLNEVKEVEEAPEEKSGEKKANEVTEPEKEYVHRERFYGSASREYYVGDIELTDVKAHFDNGVLTVSFPKESAEKKAKTNKISIE